MDPRAARLSDSPTLGSLFSRAAERLRGTPARRRPCHLRRPGGPAGAALFGYERKTPSPRPGTAVRRVTVAERAGIDAAETLATAWQRRRRSRRCGGAGAKDGAPGKRTRTSRRTVEHVRQRIVEVVRDASGQNPQALQFLCLPEPLLALFAVRHIRTQREYSGRISRLEVHVLRRTLLGMTTENSDFKWPCSRVGLISRILQFRTVLPDDYLVDGTSLPSPARRLGLRTSRSRADE